MVTNDSKLFEGIDWDKSMKMTPAEFRALYQQDFTSEPPPAKPFRHYLLSPAQLEALGLPFDIDQLSHEVYLALRRLIARQVDADIAPSTWELIEDPRREEIILALIHIAKRHAERKAQVQAQTDKRQDDPSWGAW